MAFHSAMARMRRSRLLKLLAWALALWEALSLLLLAAEPFRTFHPAWPAEVARRVRLAARVAEGR